MVKARKNKKVDTIDGLARLMQTEFAIVHKEIGGLKSDVTGLKSDVTDLKSDVSGLKGDMAIVHRRLDNVEHEIREMRKNSSELFTKLDKFISLYSDTKQELTLLARQVKRLDDRVAQLEARR